MGEQYFWQELARTGQRGPAEQASPHAAGSAPAPAGYGGEGHQ